MSVGNVLYVGFGGTNNSLNVSEGSVTAANLWVGREATSANNAVMLSNGATVNATSQVVVGYGGTSNTMQILGGSKVTASGPNNLEVGKDAGADGNSLIVSGLGSELTATDGFLLGRAGAGNSLVVDDGAKLVTGQARIGNDASSDGNTAIVDGGGVGGASWTVNGTLRVGSQGDNNTLNITNGGVVTATQNIWVGYTDTSNSNNLITVSGLNSRLETAADLIIGPNAGASNRVVVADGGGVVADTIEMPNGTLQIGNGGNAGLVQAALIYSTNGGGLVQFTHTNLSYNFDVPMAGTLSVLHNAAGKTVLSASNTYNGTTTVSAGDLVVDGSIANSATTALGGGTIYGSGTTGELTIDNGGTISPGSSGPGSLSANGDVNWLGGGNYNWQIYDTTLPAGTGWDLLTSTGVLDLSSLTSANKFNLNLWSLSGIGPEVNGNALNFDNTQSYTWTILTAAGGINAFAADKFNINLGAANGTGGFVNGLGGGTFTLLTAGNNLNLVFTAAGAAVPEPGTWAAAALLAGGAAFARWRKRRAVLDKVEDGKSEKAAV